MRVLGAIVKIPALRHFVDEEPESGTENDTLVKGVADHVESLVVDTMELLHALNVVLL